ncbi:MAG: hypothetical protein EXS03_04830 [Phycisphaerales bacterium]|nr:hypothetical protein [Phycisphaerales bacterium]
MCRAATEGSTRPRHWHLAVCAAVCVSACLVTPSVRAADDAAEADDTRALTEWLSQAGLDGLLAAVLEEEVRKAPSTNASSIARLSEAYIRLLRTASDEDRLADLRNRVLRFLSRERHPDEIQLRLAVAHADYRLALRDIEQLRRGHSDHQLASRATAALARASDPLREDIALLRSRIDEDRRLAAGADDAQRQGVLELEEQHQQQLLEAKFLRSWCAYWALWISRPSAGVVKPKSAIRDELVLDALRQWAEILETGIPFPEPVHASIDLRGEEYYAQSILGMALTKALKGPMALADGWFELLDSDGIWSGLRDHGGWLYQALVDTGEYQRAGALLSDTTREVDPDEAVGGAVRAFVESAGSPEAGELARHALAHAAGAGDLAAVRRIGGAVPQLSVGDGFEACLVRGIEQYEMARTNGVAASARSAFTLATTELAKAAALAPSLSKAAAGVEELLAWSQLGAGQHCDAAESFENASVKRSGNQADESLWMALRMAELGKCPAKDSSDGSRSAEIAARYLQSYPAGNHTEAAMATLARSPGAHLDGTFVDALLSHARRDDAVAEVREAAATLLYRRFRAASAHLRREEALRLLSIPAPPAARWVRGGIDLVVRQQLEAALDPAVRQLSDGRRLLGEIGSVYARMQEPQGYRAEIAVRRLSLALEERDISCALESLTDLRAVADPLWRPVGEALFVVGIERMEQEGALRGVDAGLVARAISHSRRSLRDAALRTADTSRADSASIALGRALIEEARAIRGAIAADDASARDQASALDREALAIAAEVLAHREDNAHAVALKADAAMACGEFDVAYGALIRLVGGLPERSDEWFSRKADLCELLARTDPVEARGVLAQHAVLVPEWGPGAGGQRLRALAQRLGIVPNKVTPR